MWSQVLSFSTNQEHTLFTVTLVPPFDVKLLSFDLC